VVCLKTDDDELIVLDPEWVGTDVIGHLLSDEIVNRLPHDGRLTVDQLRAAIPGSQPLDMARLLAAMYLCAPLHPELDHEVVLPCLDRSDEPSLDVKLPLVNGLEQTSDKVQMTVNCTISYAQNPFPSNFPVDWEACNLLRTSCGLVSDTANKLATSRCNGI